MTKGMKAKLHCPAEKAYGAAGAGKIIPPNSVLTFDVQLIDINPKEVDPVKSDKDSASKSRRKRKQSWKDLPEEGDASTHQCFEPVMFYGAFTFLMLSLGYLLYACLMPVSELNRQQNRNNKIK